MIETIDDIFIIVSQKKGRSQCNLAEPDSLKINNHTNCKLINFLLNSFHSFLNAAPMPFIEYYGISIDRSVQITVLSGNSTGILTVSLGSLQSGFEAGSIFW